MKEALTNELLKPLPSKPEEMPKYYVHPRIRKLLQEMQDEDKLNAAIEKKQQDLAALGDQSQMPAAAADAPES